MSRRFSREQRTTVIYGVLSVSLVIVVLQLWLFTATMNAFLGGDSSVVWPAAGVSVLCLGLIGGLLYHVYRLERPRP